MSSELAAETSHWANDRRKSTTIFTGIPQWLACCLILSCAVGTPAYADSLSDLKARLQQFELGDSSSGAPKAEHSAVNLKARVEFESWSRTGDDGKAKTSEAKVDALLEKNRDALKVSWSNDLLQKAEQERRAQSADSEKQTPTRDALAELTAIDLQKYVQSANTIGELIEHATLLAETSDVIDGKTARLLDLKIDPNFSKKQTKYINEAKATCKLWLDSDGMPIAAEQHLELRGSFMVVIRFAHEQNDEYRYARIGNQLVTVSHAHRQKSSGAGEQFESRTITALRFDNAELVSRVP
jgi:hypothetical protein